MGQPVTICKGSGTEIRVGAGPGLSHCWASPLPQGETSIRDMEIALGVAEAKGRA